MRAVTTVVVRVPVLWRVLKGPVKSNFDKLAPDWDATRVDESRLRAIGAALDAVHLDHVTTGPARMLDLGTGSGVIVRKLTERWPEAEVTGVDLSPEMVSEARRLSTSPAQRYDVADASALPFADEAFDLVTMNNMIPFFDELARVTAPGGSVVIAYGLGPQTPIYVPLDRVERELRRRGFTDVATFSDPPGVALLARKPVAS